MAISKKDDISELNFPSPLSKISLNSTLVAFLLIDGKLFVQSLYIDENGNISQIIFPDKDVASQSSQSFKITCFAISEDFLVYATLGGVIHHYSISDWVLINEIKHKQGIKSLNLSPNGVKFTFVDEKGDVYFSNPVIQYILKLPVKKSIGSIWNKSSNCSNATVFIVWDSEFITVFAFYSYSIRGPECLSLGTCKLPFGLVPIILLDGKLSCLTPNGKMTDVLLYRDTPSDETGLGMYYPSDLTDVAIRSEYDQIKLLQLIYNSGKINGFYK